MQSFFHFREVTKMVLKNTDTFKVSVFYGEKNAFMPSIYLGLDKDLNSAQEPLSTITQEHYTIGLDFWYKIFSFRKEEHHG